MPVGCLVEAHKKGVVAIPVQLGWWVRKVEAIVRGVTRWEGGVTRPLSVRRPRAIQTLLEAHHNLSTEHTGAVQSCSWSRPHSALRADPCCAACWCYGRNGMRIPESELQSVRRSRGARHCTDLLVAQLIVRKQMEAKQSGPPARGCATTMLGQVCDVSV